MEFLLVYVLKDMTSGMANNRAQACVEARWTATIDVPDVHQPLPTATITSG
jgi:hypothetical protein